MTLHHADGGEELGTEDVLVGWYRHAGRQPGSVGTLLRLLREREGTTIAEQQAAFGADARAFAHLQSMRQPRAHRYAADARRIAVACRVGRPLAVVQALLLARGLAAAAADPPADDCAYQATFDATDDLS
jgi:hypothetical protein